MYNANAYISTAYPTKRHKIQNTLGELNVGEALDATLDNIDPSPPTRWGRGFKGPRRESFPLPDEYALDADETPLD
eukprot:scaffold11434_cov127-Isochrysis_galbana.AAC.17